MSVTSSVSEGGAVGDIIDLDRYMRASVRPSAPHRNERLVVDAGAVGRRPVSPSSGSARGSSSDVPRVSHVPGHYGYPQKRFSHDSGVSDGSCVRRKQRNRRLNEGNTKARESSRHSGSSIREFRVVCEKALKEQQEQIARVAQICERLANTENVERDRQIEIVRNERDRQRTSVKDVRQRHGSSVRDERARQPASQHAASEPTGDGTHMNRAVRGSTPSSDSSELTSSSKTTLGQQQRKRKEKHMAESCKTYKIIMTKLDEMNRVFAARRQYAPAPRAPPPLSSSSVSVCDKLVATEPDEMQAVANVPPTVQTVLRSSVTVEQAGPRRLEVARANDLDIAPAHAHRNNVLVHSIVESEDSSGCSARALNHCGFDLDDPVHLYAQAKRLNSQTVRPAPRERRDCDVSGEYEMRGRGERARAQVSLCSLCRSYWRSLWRCLPSYVTKDS